MLCLFSLGIDLRGEIFDSFWMTIMAEVASFLPQ